MSPRVGLEMSQILKTAAEMIDSEGNHELTLTKLAQKLVIKPPSLYNHITNLQDLRNRLSLYGLRMLYDDMLMATTEKGHDQLRALARAYITFARNHPGLYEVTLKAPEKLIDLQNEEIGKQIIDLVIKCLKPYQLSYEESIHAVRVFRSTLHGFASLEKQGGFGIELSIDESIEFFLKAYVAGIKGSFRRD